MNTSFKPLPVAYASLVDAPAAAAATAASPSPKSASDEPNSPRFFHKANWELFLVGGGDHPEKDNPTKASAAAADLPPAWMPSSIMGEVRFFYCWLAF